MKNDIKNIQNPTITKSVTSELKKQFFNVNPWFKDLVDKIVENE